VNHLQKLLKKESEVFAKISKILAGRLAMLAKIRRSEPNRPEARTSTGDQEDTRQQQLKKKRKRDYQQNVQFLTKYFILMVK